MLFLVICIHPVFAADKSNEHLIPVIDFLLIPSNTTYYPPDTSFTSIPTEASVPYPGYLDSITGPVFGNRITRLSDYPDVQVNFPYPKTPSWNSDGTLLMLPYRLLDGRTYQLIADHTWWRDDERKWSAIYPHIYYAMQHGSDHVFVKRDVTVTLESGSVPTKEVLISFPGAVYDEVLLGKYEGNIDHQDKYIIFCARKKSVNYLTAIVFDIELKQIVIQKDMIADQEYPYTINWQDPDGEQELDWITISPSGRHILINWKKDPDNLLGEYKYSIDQFDMNLNFVRELAHQGQHGDIGVDGSGRDMYVQFEFRGDRKGIWGYSLDNGRETKLLPKKYNGGHISCRNYQRPGWCYPSTTQEGYREVFALKLDGSGTVNRFAQTHTTGGNSHGGVSPDGTKIIFSSDWGGATPIITGSQRHIYEAFVVEAQRNSGNRQ
jgi:hypothetical protein